MAQSLTSHTDWLFQGSGEIRALCRTFDWSKTTIGPVHLWPQSLRTAVQIVLASPFPNIILWGPELIHIYNEGYREIMGDKHPAGLGQSTQQCWPEVWHINEPIYQRVWAGESFRFDDALYPITRSGQPEDAWFTLAYSPVRNESGEVGGILVSVFETTDRVLEQQHRQQAQQDLQQSEQRFRLLVKATSEMIYTMSADWEQMLLLDGKDYLIDNTAPNMNWLEQYIPAAEQGFVLNTIQQAITHQIPFEAEYQVIRRDGSLGWVASRAIPILDQTGQLQQWLGAASDITERKKIEEVLRESEERQAFLLKLSDALRPLADPIETQATAVRLLGEHLRANQVHYGETIGDDVVIHLGYGNGLPPMVGRFRSVDFGEKLTATHRAGLVRIVEDVGTDSMNTEAERQALQAAHIGAYITVPLIKEGNWVATLAVHSICPRNWTTQDIELVKETAERTWAAVERARAEQDLMEADRRKDEFMAMLGHELRNPLAAITNTLLLLQLTQGQDESMSYPKGIEILTRHSEHLTHMVDDLLDITRIRQGIVRLQWEVVNLSQTLQLTVESAQPYFRKHDRLLSLTLPPSLLYVNGDEARLSQVIMNLLTNGAAYTHSGGQVWVSLEQTDDEAILRVRDNGIGLSFQEQTSIFDVFVQGRTSLDRPHSGLGLGLSVVKHLVEQHGGQIEALSSGVGQGSEFVIRLPLLMELPYTAPTLRADRLPTTGRILIVDDNQDFAEMTARLLRSKGFDVYTRYTGTQGIEAAKRLEPDAVLLDIGMPQLDGYEVCRQIRSQPWGKSFAIIALTGYGQEADKQKAIAVGFDVHLLKPVNLGTMAQTVAQAILKKKSNTNR